MFRVNTFEIHLPPLRDRIHDIEPLAGHLLARFCRETRSEQTVLSDDALRSLAAHPWPGNVRELANVIEHATILCDEGPITSAHLPRRFSMPRLPRDHGKGLGNLTLREIELQAIHEALERHDGSKPKAAQQLGISLKTLYNKLNQSVALEKSA